MVWLVVGWEMKRRAGRDCRSQKMLINIGPPCSILPCFPLSSHHPRRGPLAERGERIAASALPSALLCSLSMGEWVHWSAQAYLRVTQPSPCLLMHSCPFCKPEHPVCYVIFAKERTTGCCTALRTMFSAPLTLLFPLPPLDMAFLFPRFLPVIYQIESDGGEYTLRHVMQLCTQMDSDLGSWEHGRPIYLQSK